MGELAIRSVAWSGEAPVDRIDVMVGARPWRAARPIGEGQPHRWPWWELLTGLDRPADINVPARATDLARCNQPARPEWNRLRYGANSIQVVTLRAR